MKNVYKGFISLDKVKEVSYKNHWMGLIPGIPIGFTSGLITGLLGLYPTYTSQPNMGTTGQTQSYDLAGSVVIGSGIGIAAGGILGWLLGYNYTYIFNH